jgi:hypothetical protein
MLLWSLKTAILVGMVVNVQVIESSKIVQF